MSQLPSSWAECSIGAVAQIVAGGTPPSKDASNFTTGDSGIPWVTPADLSGYKKTYISRGARSLTEKGFRECSAVKMPSGSVLFSSRAPIGYVAIAANEITTNQGFKSFVLPDDLNNHFIYYYLKYIKPVAEEMATGTTFKELSSTAAATIPLIVAPSREQKRIADKLDAVLSQVDACRDRLDRVPAILKRFRQSVLAAATSCKLTADWRVERALPDPITTSIGEWCDVLGGKRLPKGFELTNEDTGYPYVRVTDFSGFSVKLPQLRFVPIEAADVIKRYTINSDDVYISIAGTIGLVGQVPPTISGSNLTENAARIVAREGFVPRFLMYQLAAPAAQDQMQQKKIATTQDKLGLFRIKELELLKPSIEEQTEIVCRIEALFAYADRLEARHQAARTQVEKLTPSTLAKAFRGELVTQDPNDEPASALLERIKSGRADGAAKPKRARTTDSAYVPVKLKEKSNMTKSRQDDDVREQPYLAAHLRKLGGTARVESLFDASELPVADFYKQLAWEVSKNMVRDAGEKLELGDAT